MALEPITGEPAAVATTGDERLLVVADYHAGIEAGLRREGVEIASQGDDRRYQIRALLERTGVDRLLVLGDLGHAIGEPGDEERSELTAFAEMVTERIPLTVVMGNHDGGVESVLDGFDQASVAVGQGARFGPIGFAHGHTWPSPDVLGADILCVGHEHPVVRLEDEVGGDRRERVWLRGGVNPEPFREFHGEEVDTPDELVIAPAFNDLSGGTWVNVEEQSFLCPFLPDALDGGDAYLLDGTRLGQYRRV